MSKYTRGKDKYYFDKMLTDIKLRDKYDTCCVCFWDRSTVDFCHIIPDRKGASYCINNIVPLCPNHHRLLDRNILEDYEMEHITSFIYSIYEKLEKRIMDKLISEEETHANQRSKCKFNDLPTRLYTEYVNK